jgi:hypothetical protein
MPQHSFDIPNESGLLFRQDVNNAFKALAQQSSGNSAPSTTYPFMFWCDTSGSTPILKFRNAADSAWIVLGDMSLVSMGLNSIVYGNSAPSSPQPFQMWVDTSGSNPIFKYRNQANNAWIEIGRGDLANFGLLLLTGGTLSGPLLFSNTDYMKVPVGTTGQRPGSPANGMVRYNTSLSQFEGYKAGAWGPLGGGGYVVGNTQSIDDGDPVVISTTDVRQLIPVQGNGGAINLEATPFGNAGGWVDGTEVLLVCLSDSETISFTANDADKGAVGNFETITLGKYQSAKFTWLAASSRWIYV